MDRPSASRGGKADILEQAGYGGFGRTVIACDELHRGLGELGRLGHDRSAALIATLPTRMVQAHAARFGQVGAVV